LLFYHKSLASWASGFIFYQLKRGCALFLFSATAPLLEKDTSLIQNAPGSLVPVCSVCFVHTLHKSFKSFVPKRLDSKINQWVSCFFDHDTKKQLIIARQSRENLLYLYIRTVMECSTHRNSAGICQDCAKMLT
jgi:hypothetical protein